MEQLVAHGGRLLSATTALALLMTIGATGQAAAKSSPTSTRVGDTKTACAYTSESTAALESLSKSVGRPIDCALLFSDNTTDWATWEQPWLIRNTMPDYRWADWVAAKSGRRVVVTQALVPAGLPSDWRQQGAAGAYDDHIRAWAANMINGGFGSATIRLGHEANGDWYFDSIGYSNSDYASWAAFWSRFAHIAKGMPGAHFTFDWTVNAGYRRIPFSAFYPGDKAVDIVGIDQYDGMAIAPHPLPRTPQAHWAALVSQRWGLNDLVGFAARHHKPISIPEWGLLSAGSANGTGMGDDPLFIDGIAKTVRENPTSYEAVWDTRSPTSPTATAIEDSPSAMAAYRKHFGAHGDSLPQHGPGTKASATLARGGLVPTYVTAAISAPSVKPGMRITIKAMLVGGGHALSGQRLVLQRLVRQHWSTVGAATTGADGRLVVPDRPRATTLYRVVFPSAAGRAGSASAALTVRITAAKKS